MPRNTMFFLFFLWGFLWSSPVMAGVVRYKGDAKPDTKSAIAVIVAPDRYDRDTDLDDTREDIKPRGKAWAQELTLWNDFTHVVLFTGADAKEGNIMTFLSTTPNVQRISLVWLGLGIGKDTGTPCLMPADFNHDAFGHDGSTCIAPAALKDLLAERAHDVDVILDVTPAMGVNKMPKQFANLALLGPDATDFEAGPCASCFALSSAKGRSAPDVDRFNNDLLGMLRMAREQRTKVTYGQIITGLAAVDLAVDVVYQGVNPSDPFLEKPGDPVVKDIASPPTVPEPIATLPTELKPEATVPVVPPEVKPETAATTKRKLCPSGEWKPSSTGFTVAGAGLAIVSVVSGVLLDSIMQQVKDQETINANFSTQEELDLVAPWRERFGYTMLATGGLSAAAFAGTGISVCR